MKFADNVNKKLEKSGELVGQLAIGGSICLLKGIWTGAKPHVKPILDKLNEETKD